MAERGKLIAVEGIDGSGKHTQIELLSKSMEARGVRHVRVSFPRYQSAFGRLVARYLNGEFGRLDEVDAHLSAILFAGDRFEFKTELEAALADGKTVLADRYVGSNLAHQTARAPLDAQGEFLGWLRHLEYGIYGLPEEDLVIYLRLPAPAAHRLIGMKAARSYTSMRRDLQEDDLKHLEAAALVYDRLAKQTNWATIQCLESSGELRAPDIIHRAVLEAVEGRLAKLIKGR